MSGYDVELVDEERNVVVAGRDRGSEAAEEGRNYSVALRLPLPPGCLTGIFDDDERFLSTYLRKV